MAKRKRIRDLSLAWREGQKYHGDVPTGKFRSFLLFLILLTSALIATRCELIDDLFDNDEKKQENTSDTGILKVGPDGGQVSLNQLYVYIAAGTFDKEQNILITTMEGDDDFGENASSAVYQISGLPEIIHKPVRIAIKYDGILTGDPLIAIGEEMYATSLDSVLTAYHTQIASDSAGYLVYHFPANASQIKSWQESNIAKSTLVKLVALNKFKTTLSSNNHFLISYPLANQQEGVILGQHFEKAYETCLEMGFSFEGKEWPVPVIAKKLANNNRREIVCGFYGFTPPGGSGFNDSQFQASVKTGKITINTHLFSDNEELAVTVGHEFLHMVQHLYEFSAPWIEPEQSWLQEASAVWFEEKFTDKPYYMSSNHQNREIYMFDGWQYKDRGYAKNGYGLSPIIKGVAERYGDDAIVKMFELIKEGVLPTDAVDPVDAVFSVITEPVVHFWHSVLGAYLLGYSYHVYGNTKPDKTCAMDAIKVVIEPEIQKDYIFNYSAHDLSGLIFILTGGNLTAQSTVPLTFSVNDPEHCGILVGKVANAGLLPIVEFFPGEGERVFIEDTKALFDEGYILMVMVSNGHHDKEANYQGMSEIELKIEIAKPPVARFEKVSLSYALDLKWDNLCSASNSSPPGPDYTFQAHTTRQEPIELYLHQSGNTFSGSWTGHTNYLPGFIYTGSIKFTLRDDENTPVDFAEENMATSVEFEIIFEEDRPYIPSERVVPQIFGWNIKMTNATYLLRPNGNVEIFLRGQHTCEQLVWEHKLNCYTYNSNEFRYVSCAPQCSRDHAAVTIMLSKASSR